MYDWGRAILGTLCVTREGNLLAYSIVDGNEWERNDGCCSDDGERLIRMCWQWSWQEFSDCMLTLAFAKRV